MNKAQWEYIKIRLVILGCIAGLALIILGMVYDWAVIYFALILAFLLWWVMALQSLLQLPFTDGE